MLHFLYKGYKMILLGDKIKMARKNKGLSQEQLAEKLDVNRVTISNYENGKNNPTHTNLLKLSAILGVQLVGSGTRITKFIPLIGRASCGIPKDYNLSDFENIPIDSRLFRDGMYAVEAEGDSMLSKINDGDIVYCSPNENIHNGNIVHYTYNGDSGIKKYKVSEKQDIISLIPLNSEYDALIINEYEARDLKMAKVVAVVDTNF